MQNYYSIENQVITLDQAKAWHGVLGFNALPSFWQWECRGENAKLINKTFVHAPLMNREYYYAYTGDELSKMLPAYIVYNGIEYILSVWRVNDQFFCAYGKICRLESAINDDIGSGYTLAESLADLALIGFDEGWLKKEDLSYEN